MDLRRDESGASNVTIIMILAIHLTYMYQHSQTQTATWAAKQVYTSTNNIIDYNIIMIGLHSNHLTLITVTGEPKCKPRSMENHFVPVHLCVYIMYGPACIHIYTLDVLKAKFAYVISASSY